MPSPFPHGPHARRRFRRRAGMTLIEVTVSMLVLMVAVAATLGTITSFSSLEDSNSATIRAYLAARRTIESLQAAPFSEVFVRFNADPADDPGGAGTAEGSGFAVESLDVRDGDADGFAGAILFPVDPATPGVLREDFVEASYGMPRDLNADGVQDAVNRAGDYIALPVRVRIEWTGRSGDRAVQLQTVLLRR